VLNRISRKAIFDRLEDLTTKLKLLAQGKFEIAPYAGYMFGGRLRFFEGDLKIKDNVNYGLALDIELVKETKLELFWSEMQTTAEFRPFYGFDYLDIDPFDVRVGYIQIGTVREFDYDNIKPFGVMTIGTTYFLPQNVSHQDSWKFSVSLGGGANIWFTERIGIRLQGRLLLPILWGGAGFTIGTGGAGITVVELEF
jgi:hypothetical protein